MYTRNARPFVILQVALVSIASTGCQTLSTKMGREAPRQATASEQSTPTGMAKTDFRREISRDQQFNVHLEMAKVHESQENNEAALAEYEQAIAIGERRGSILSTSTVGPEPLSIAHRRMAATYDRMGRFVLSETHYGKALKLAPNDPRVWNDIGYSYYLQNRLDDAERSLKTAQTFAPNDARILTNLGLTLAMKGKIDDALAVLGRAGGPAVSHANLGFILAASGKPVEAKKQYETALALQPELAPVRQALARLDQEAGQTAVARREEPALKTFEVDPGVAAASAALGKGSEAVETKTAAIEPNDAKSDAVVSTNFGGVAGPPQEAAAPSAAPSAQSTAETTAAKAPDGSAGWIEPATGAVAASPLASPQTKPEAAVLPPPSEAAAPAPASQEAQPSEQSAATTETLSMPDDPAKPAPAQSPAPAASEGQVQTTPQSPLDLLGPKPSDPSTGAPTVATEPTSAEQVPQAIPDTPAPSEKSIPLNVVGEPAPVVKETQPSPQSFSDSVELPAERAEPQVAVSSQLPLETAQDDSAPAMVGAGGNGSPASFGNVRSTPQQPAANTVDPSSVGAIGQAPSKATPVASAPAVPSPLAAPSKVAPVADPALLAPSKAAPYSANPLGAATNPSGVNGTPQIGSPRPQSKTLPGSANQPRRKSLTPPSKIRPVGTVPGWAVPKNYTEKGYPPTPSDTATAAPEKATPQSPPSNMVPPSPW